MRASCSASATSDISGSRPSTIASFSAPALRMPSLVQPLAGLREDLEQLRIRLDGAQLERACAWCGKRSRKPCGNHSSAEAAQAPGGRQHVALEVVAAAAQLVQHERILSPVRQQARLVGFAAVLNELRSPARAARSIFAIGSSRATISRMRSSSARSSSRRERCAAAHRAEVAADRRRRVLDHHVGFGKDLGGGGHQQERERPPVDARAVGVGRRDGRDVGIADERRLQLAQPSVDDRGDHGRGAHRDSRETRPSERRPSACPAALRRSRPSARRACTLSRGRHEADPGDRRQHRGAGSRGANADGSRSRAMLPEWRWARTCRRPARAHRLRLEAGGWRPARNQPAAGGNTPARSSVRFRHAPAASLIRPLHP